MAGLGVRHCRPLSCSGSFSLPGKAPIMRHRSIDDQRSLADSALSVLLANVNIIANGDPHSSQRATAKEAIRRKRRQLAKQSTRQATSRTFISPCQPSSTLVVNNGWVSSSESLNFIPLQEATSALLAARALAKTGGADLDADVDTNSTTNDFSAFAWEILDTMLASAGSNGHIPRYAYPFNWNSSHSQYIPGTSFPSASFFDGTAPKEYTPAVAHDAPPIFASGRISSPPFHATMALHSFYLSNQTDTDLLGLSRTFSRLERYHRFLHEDVMRGCKVRGKNEEGQNTPCYIIIHPWESIVEQSSPLWEKALQPIIEQMDSESWSPAFQIPTEVMKSYDFPREKRLYDAMLYLVDCQRNATVSFGANKNTTGAQNSFETHLLERCPFAMLDVGNAAALARADQDLLAIGEILLAGDIPRTERPTRLELQDLSARSERSTQILDSLWNEKSRSYQSRAIAFSKSGERTGTYTPTNETVPIAIPISSSFLGTWGWGDNNPGNFDEKTKSMAYQLQGRGRHAFSCGEYPISSIGGCRDQAIVDPAVNYFASFGLVGGGLGGLGRYIRNSTLNMICRLPNVDSSNLSSCPNNAAFPSAFGARSSSPFDKVGCSSTCTATAAVIFNMYVPDKAFEYTAPPPPSSSWVIFLIALELAFALGVGLSCVFLSLRMMRHLNTENGGFSFLYGDNPGEEDDGAQQYDLQQNDTASAANAALLGEELGRLQGLERDVGASPIIKASSPLRNVQRFLFRTGVGESTVDDNEGE